MEDMPRSVAVRFVPAAVGFLLTCVAILFLAAASTLAPAGVRDSRESRAAILSTFLR
jgi:hypothetical protein